MLDLLAPPRLLADLFAAERQVIRGLRLWALVVRQRRCPLRTVAGQVGSLRAAAHLHLMLEEISAAWPEPFAVGPPCCGRMSHDEATVGEMMRRAQRNDRAAFDRLLEEMIPADEREKLFHSASVLGRVLEETGRSSGYTVP